MSDTPRTDAVLEVDCVGDDYSPLIEHARQLERELAEAKKADRLCAEKMPDSDARWLEVQRIASEVACKDEAPTEVESALCAAVTFARSALTRAETAERERDEERADKDALLNGWRRSSNFVLHLANDENDEDGEYRRRAKDTIATCEHKFPYASKWIVEMRDRALAAESRVAELTKALETLKAYNEEIKAGHINYRPNDHIQVATVAPAEKSLESARDGEGRDAARYRGMRDNWPLSLGDQMEHWSHEHFDAAIDSALAAAGKVKT